MRKRGDSWINIDENPITNPPIEILYRNKEAVLNYFKQIKEQGEDYLYEGKVLIVGEGGVGKTSLMRKLIKEDYPIPNNTEKSTLGINVHNGWAFKLTGKYFKANLWDFGGQEIQYTTHQFFLTQRSVYILVLDARKENHRLNYWLSIVNLLGKNSPVLIIHNRLRSTAFKRLNFQKYQEKYENKMKVGYLTVDLATQYDSDGRFQVVKKNVQEFIGDLPQMGTYIPKHWIAVRNELQEILDQRKLHYISYKQYLNICRSNDLMVEKDCLTLSGYLHDLGILLHYQEDPFLSDILILDPKWAVGGVYAVLMNQNVIDNCGKFEFETLSEIWKNEGYDSFEGKYLLQLMLKEKFELCYRIDSRNENRTLYFAPQLLQPEPPAHFWDEEKVKLNFIYKYPFMPKGIIHRLIVRMNDLIHHENEKYIQWSEGVVLCKGENKAKITEETSREDGLSIIKIQVTGVKNSGKRFLHDIRNEIEEIHAKSFEEISYQTLVPCPCTECISSLNTDLYYFKTSYLENKIKKFQEDKITNHLFAECRNSLLVVSIKDILDNFLFKDEIEDKIYKEESGKNIPKVYLCHAQDDEPHKNKLDKHLATLKINRKIETWYYSKILPGEEWNSKIEENLNNSDIIILLVSVNAITSKNINLIEIPKILERLAKGKCKFVPVILNHCDWKDFYQLGKYNYLPDNGKSIAEWPSEDAAWQNVVRGLKRLL